MLSRRSFLAAAAVGAVKLALAACSAGPSLPSPTFSTATPSPSPSPSQSPSPSPSPSPAGVPLRQRIGQLLLVGFRGRTIEEAEPIRSLVAAGLLGGVILFSVDQESGGPRNVESPDQLATLVAGLRNAAPEGVPLIVAIDQEGGQVARLNPSHGFPPTQSAAELGRGDPTATRAAASAMASTLASVGVTLNLAPVVDLAVNPDNPIIAAIERSFSADPGTVIAHATAFVEGHREHGIRCALKHFPGQGSASGDTHQGVVDVTGAWTDVELEPFSALVAGGAADAVLTAHIYNATLDPDHPATLSAKTVDGILRQQIGFGGPVVSDDLQMRAISDAYGAEETVALALNAGVDLLLFANQLVYDPQIVERTISIVEQHVADGRISEARIDAAVARVATLRGG